MSSSRFISNSRNDFWVEGSGPMRFRKHRFMTLVISKCRICSSVSIWESTWDFETDLSILGVCTHVIDILDSGTGHLHDGMRDVTYLFHTTC